MLDTNFIYYPMKRSRICLPIKRDQLTSYAGLEIIGLDRDRTIEHPDLFVVTPKVRITQ